MPHDPEHDPHLAVNRAWWDAVVPIHEASRGYDREGFLRGEQRLCAVELEELAPLVAGRTFLHLQCHFGMDTLGWARLGARVTGLDFSEPAVAAARRLSEESGVPGRFVTADVLEAPAALGETFDVVYTGIGALNWLPDIRAWARAAAACVRPGGVLYVHDCHPVLFALDQERTDGELVLKEAYFERREPLRCESSTTYVDGPPLARTSTREWNHGLGEVVTAVIDAGLSVVFLHEHREVPWKALPGLEPVDAGGPGADGRYQARRAWRLPEGRRDAAPLMFSLLARRVD